MNKIVKIMLKHEQNYAHDMLLSALCVLGWVIGNYSHLSILTLLGAIGGLLWFGIGISDLILYARYYHKVIYR